MKINQKQIHFFRAKIQNWHHYENDRIHPWSKEKDPYKIWLSEIILQQTQVAQGLPYYKRFIEQYPDIHSLAKANDEAVFRLWQGLGYYNRCRNLLFTARYISKELGGILPDNYKDILALKGVGSYTAAAIASFAYDLPYAVVDGNVQRLLSRFWGIETPIDSTAGKKLFQEIAQTLLPNQSGAAYNQAVMDFGATICKPRNPLCNECPLYSQCQAVKLNIVALLPVKSKKIKVKKRYFNYFLLVAKDKVFIQKRTENDIWQNLFEFYCIESENFQNQKGWQMLLPFIEKKQIDIFQNKQRLTHQLIISHFHTLKLNEIPLFLQNGLWLSFAELNQFAFPKTILSFLNQLGRVEVIR